MKLKISKRSQKIRSVKMNGKEYMNTQNKTELNTTSTKKDSDSNDDIKE